VGERVVDAHRLQKNNQLVKEQALVRGFGVLAATLPLWRMDYKGYFTTLFKFVDNTHHYGQP